MGIEIGQLVFAKKIRTSHGKNFLEYGATGNYATLLLGHVNKGDTPPDEKEFFQMVSSAGLVSLEDVLTCLGAESMEKILSFLITKYKTGDAQKPKG